MKHLSSLVPAILLAATATETAGGTGLSLADKPAPDEKPEQESPALVVPPCKTAGDVLARARALSDEYAIDKNMLANMGAFVLQQDGKGAFVNDEESVLEEITEITARLTRMAANLIALRNNPGVHANFKDTSLSARRVAESFAQIGRTDLRIINKALK